MERGRELILILILLLFSYSSLHVNGSCCYNCEGEDDPDSIVDELFTNISTSYRDANFMRGEGIEVQAGLENGELLDFQLRNVRSSYCPSIDPRLT